MIKNKFFRILFLLFTIYNNTAHAQHISYEIAHKKAFQGEIDSALVVIDSLLLKNPDYLDVIILKARILGWKNQFNTSKMLLDSALKINSTYYDALDAYSDVEYWDKKYPNALLHVNNALLIYPNDSLFLVKKHLLDSLVTNGTLKIEYPCSDFILFQYYFDAFNEYYNRRWSVFTIGKPIKQIDNYLFLPKINIGHLAPINGVTTYNALQIENDLFYVPDSNYYIYANAGFANFRLFPKYKAAFEYFMAYLYSTELSVGLRYMLWESHNFFSTVSVAKYIGNYLVMFKPYFPFKNFGEGNAYVFTLRRYFSKDDNIGISYVFGAAPDQSFNQFLEYGAFSSQKIMLSSNSNVKSKYKLSLSISYSVEEYQLNQFQNRFDFLIGFTFCH